MTNVAVLEDDLKIANFIGENLKAETYQVDHFALIHDFTDKLKETEFDILILDRMIGKLDSVNFIKTFKGLAPNMKIIIVSSLGGRVNQKIGSEAGADDYIEKPFQYSELSLRVKKLLKNDKSHLSEVL